MHSDGLEGESSKPAGGIIGMMSERLKPCFRVACTMLALALLLAAASFFSAFAGPLEDELRNGEKAYKRSDFATAMGLLRPLAERGNAAAQQYLGLMYEFGQGAPNDYEEAMKWTLMSAKQGNALAQFGMANFYRYGWGVPKDDILGYMWESLAGHDPKYQAVAK
jgi:TPR repeat protein